MDLSWWGMANWYFGKDPGFSIPRFCSKSHSLAIFDHRGSMVDWITWSAPSQEYRQPFAGQSDFAPSREQLEDVRLHIRNSDQ